MGRSARRREIPVRCAGAYKVLSLLLAFAFSVSCADASDGNPQQTLSVGLGYDDNVQETGDASVSDAFSRLHYRFRWRPKRSDWSTGFSLGADKYAREKEGDKLIGSADLGWEHRTPGGATGAASVAGRIRRVRDNGRSYGKLAAETHGSIPLAGSNILSSSLRVGWLNWDEDQGDYAYQQLGVGLSRWIGSSWLLGARFGCTRKSYRQPAHREVETDAGLVLGDSGNDRVDRLQEFGLDLQVSRGILGKISYAYHVNDSNSNGESYRSHELFGAVSRSLGKRVNLHVVGAFHFRKFTDRIRDPGTERFEENDENLNQIAVKGVYRLTSNLSLFTKYSRLWDQSSIADHDFTKNVFTAGIDLSTR